MSTVTLSGSAGPQRNSSWGAAAIIALPLILASICLANKFGLIVVSGTGSTPST